MAHRSDREIPAESRIEDLYDYTQQSPARRGTITAHRGEWRPNVTDDWPHRVPVTAAELDVLEAHFGDILDALFRPKQ